MRTAACNWLASKPEIIRHHCLSDSEASILSDAFITGMLDTYLQRGPVTPESATSWPTVQGLLQARAASKALATRERALEAMRQAEAKLVVAQGPENDKGEVCMEAFTSTMSMHWTTASETARKALNTAETCVREAKDQIVQAGWKWEGGRMRSVILTHVRQYSTVTLYVCPDAAQYSPVNITSPPPCMRGREGNH